MSYRIEYDRRIGKYEVRKDEQKKFLLFLIMAVVGLIGGMMLLPDGAAALGSWMIPGDDTVTVQAFQNMTDDMRSGASLAEAFYSFCHYVIHGT